MISQANRLPTDLSADSTNDKSLSLLLDRRGAAALLGVAQRSFDRAASTGQLPKPMLIGSKKLWSRAALIRWIEAETTSKK